ncbi:hypothetical protein [Kitasatospora sp. NPDC088346]|uniref:hypothetical protein n=1 Tax=Kitasatospora sp. NPDC088346 TaxID=3364073 RepID=UPI00382EEE93
MTRARTKLLAGAAAAAALAGLALSTSASADSTPAPGPTAAPVSSGPDAAPLSQVVGSGVLDGADWSVTLTYYPVVPADYAPGERTAGSLVCLRTAFEGRVTSPYGDCAGVKGPTDTGPIGMYGQHTLPNGADLFVAQPAANVATATMSFGNAAPTTATTVTIPGTAFTAYVIPVPAASHQSALDEYDTEHHPVGHQKF